MSLKQLWLLHAFIELLCTSVSVSLKGDVPHSSFVRFHKLMSGPLGSSEIGEHTVVVIISFGDGGGLVKYSIVSSVTSVLNNVLVVFPVDAGGSLVK